MVRKSEQLAYWYFRLNGFLTIPNLVVHLEKFFHEQGHRQGTDVDILGVRFPFRKELPEEAEPMKDDEIFEEKSKITFILAEVKTGLRDIKFNDAWNNPETIKRILYCIGALKTDEEIEKCAESLIREGYYGDNEEFCFYFCLVSHEKNQDLITWEEIAKFIYNRFSKYRKLDNVSGN